MAVIFEACEIEERIGYKFKDVSLLRQCFTHSSYANENKCQDNDRLEFFGDTIIKFLETEYLFKNVGGTEGSLTTSRQEIENNEYFLKTVKKLGLDKFVLLGNGQQKNVSHHEKLFSDVYEALVAGIYLDGGLSEAKKFLKRTVFADFEKREKKRKKTEVKNIAKSQLQEYVQKRKMGSISYEGLSKTGPDHMPEFRVAVLLNGKPLSEGKGQSKAKAEAVAAANALNNLLNQDGNKR